MEFSIIVPVYNVEKYLNRCVDSILKQTFSEFELLLIEDCSLDNSKAICRDYAKKDSRVRVFCNEKNLGVSSTRNLGIELSQGRYICFVDSDDYIDEDYLMNFYNQIKDNDIDIIYSGLRYLPSGRTTNMVFPINVVKSGIELIEAAHKIFTRMVIPFSVRYCFKRQFLTDNKIIFDSTIKFGEDTVFNLTAISKADKMVCIDSVSYNYCSDNSHSATKKYKSTMLHDLEQLNLVAANILNLLTDKRQEYAFDLMKRNLFDFLICIIDNYKSSPKGFRYRDAKKLINTRFVQDSVKFYLENKLYDRKLKYFYYTNIIKRRTFIMFFIWKYFNLGKFIGIK